MVKTIVIKEGKILENAMKSIRLNIDDLGILRKINQQEATKKNLNIISVSPSYIPTEVIIDGKILENNLKKLNISKA